MNIEIINTALGQQNIIYFEFKDFTYIEEILEECKILFNERGVRK